VKTFWAIALGAAVGGVTRYYLSAAVQHRMGATFPWGTLVINVTGSIVLGFIMHYALSTQSVSVELRALLTTGFCGGYTTFSTFSYETIALMEDGQWPRAALYVLLSVGLSLIATFFGFVAARELILVRVR